MDFIFSLLTGALVVLLIVTALSIGFFLLVWFLCLAAGVTLFMMARRWVRRWLFLRSGRIDPAPPGPRIIDGEYKDITGK